MKVSPSLLACDFSKIGEEVKRAEKAGADMIHLDIMDGHFVPNISFGSIIVKAVKKSTALPLDLHLMLTKPLDYIPGFISAGAHNISFHVEAESDVFETIEVIKKAGVKPGLVLKPGTPAEAVFPYLDYIYMVLVMTVEPGFGGQTFMHDMIPKIKKLKNEIIKRKLDVLIQADGGINEKTAGLIAKAGVDVAVAGTAVFRSDDPAAEIKKLHDL